MIHIKDLLRLLLRRRDRSDHGHARPLPLVPGDRAARRRAGDDAARAIRRWWSCSTSTAAPPASSRSRICSRKLSATSTPGRRIDPAAVSRPRRPAARARNDAARRARPGVRPRPRARGGRQRQRPGARRCSDGRRRLATSVRYDRLLIEVTAVQGPRRRGVRGHAGAAGSA